MALNHPYDPRHNAKLHIPKQTEEERLARATPLENLKGLRFRTQTPAAQANAPVPTDAVPEPPALPDNAAPQDVPVSPQVPAPDYIPTALEVVRVEFPEIFKQEKPQAMLDVPVAEQRPVNAPCSADGHGGESAHHTEANLAKAPDPPSPLAYEEDDILAYANVVSFYSRPHRNTSAPKATRQRDRPERKGPTAKGTILSPENYPIPTKPTRRSGPSRAFLKPGKVSAEGTVLRF
jgi:hypothetical protein